MMSLSSLEAAFLPDPHGLGAKFFNQDGEEVEVTLKLSVQNSVGFRHPKNIEHVENE